MSAHECSLMLREWSLEVVKMLLQLNVFRFHNSSSPAQAAASRRSRRHPACRSRTCVGAERMERIGDQYDGQVQTAAEENYEQHRTTLT